MWPFVDLIFLFWFHCFIFASIVINCSNNFIGFRIKLCRILEKTIIFFTKSNHHSHEKSDVLLRRWKNDKTKPMKPVLTQHQQNTPHLITFTSRVRILPYLIKSNHLPGNLLNYVYNNACFHTCVICISDAHTHELILHIILCVCVGVFCGIVSTSICAYYAWMGATGRVWIANKLPAYFLWAIGVLRRISRRIRHDCIVVSPLFRCLRRMHI